MKIKILAGITLASLLAAAFAFYLFFSYHEELKKEELVLYGNVDIRQVDLGFRVFGRVEKLFFDEGDQVMPGQIMAQLDKVPYYEAVDAAKGRVVEAEGSLQKATAKYEKRVAVNPEAISEEDYDDALFTMEEAKGALDRVKAELATALTNLEDTDIRCPTEGAILTRIREPGSILDLGMPVYTLSIKSPLWIRAYVAEPNLGKIYFGQPATVATDTDTLPIYHGHVGFISPVAEFTPKNVETTDLRTDLVYRLRIYVEDPDHFLKQGMPVTVKLKVHDMEKEM